MENKETSAGKKQMIQMFYPDLSSGSGHPIHLRDAAWPLVIPQWCIQTFKHIEHKQRETAALR